MPFMSGRVFVAVSCAILVLLQSSGVSFATIEVRIPPYIDAVEEGYAQLNGNNVTIVKPCAVNKHFTINAKGASIGAVTVNISAQTAQDYPPTYYGNEINHIWVELTDPDNIGGVSTANVGKVDLYTGVPYNTELEYSNISGTWGTYGGTTMYAGTIDSIVSTGADFEGTIWAGSGGISWIAAQGTGVVRANITSNGTIGRISGAGGITGNITRSAGIIGIVESSGPISGNITAGSVTGKISTSSGSTGDLTGTVNVSGTINNLSVAGAVTGNITAGTIYVGKGGTGNVRTMAGTVTVSSNLYVGESYAGTYTLAGGSLTGAAAMTVATTGTFAGRGTVGLTGSLTNNGKVTADGNDTDATLSLAGFSSVLNSTENTDGYGWFATNTGKLILPALAITTETPTYNWGEAADDMDIDLVNSLCFTATESLTAGSLTISLLDKDRSEAPVAALASADYPALGIWESGSPERFTKADVTVRYDNASGGLTPAWLPSGTESTLVLGRAYPVGEGWSWRIVNWAPQIDTGKRPGA